MAFRPKKKDADTLQLYMVALGNAESQPGVAQALEEIGYDSEILNQGKQLLSETRLAFEECNSNKAFKLSESKVFYSKMRSLNTIYNRHRKTAKLVFMDDPKTAEKLAITGSAPKMIASRIEAIKLFYKVIEANEDIQTELSKLNFTSDEINKGHVKIEEVELALRMKMKIKGESQNSTKAKEAAFARMNAWMSKFYGVARLGLENEPQLLESIGKVVKS